MAGNVWEWCSDWYDDAYYRTTPASNPRGPVAGSSRVLRGGAWYCSREEYFRAAFRYHFGPTFSVLEFDFSDLGFRCASPVDSRWNSAL